MNHRQTCRRCGKSKDEKEMLASLCLQCREDRNDPKAKPTYVVTADLIFGAPKGKRIEIKS